MADATTGVLKDDASLKALFILIGGFEKTSILKINISKFKCMGKGKAQDHKAEL